MTNTMVVATFFVTPLLLGFAERTAAMGKMVYPDKDWREVTPESQGMDGAKLKAAVDFMDRNFGPDGANELVIVRNGFTRSAMRTTRAAMLNGSTR